MAKAVALTAADLNPMKPRAQSVMRQRGVVPSAELAAAISYAARVRASLQAGGARSRYETQ